MILRRVARVVYGHQAFPGPVLPLDARSLRVCVFLRMCEREDYWHDMGIAQYGPVRVGIARSGPVRNDQTP